ncbi:galectin-3-like [Physella acuta]|uniref:galectin-3-like n=1 Tax=Physella acuta TaxID=109671 RepID=UPI0027DB1D4C|nr:galectin-3-like [Physella acuta]
MTLGLVFGGADTGHVLRRVSQTYWPQNVNNVNQSVPVPGGITLGSMVHLRGIYVNYTGFYVDFRQNDDSTKVNFHFRPRLNYDTKMPVIALSYCNNGVWGSETRPNISVYPFVVNQVFEVHILVRGDAFLVYINRVFFYSYPHVMPPEKINWIRVIGVVNVTELSV